MITKKKILIVEDDEKITALLNDYLVKEGYVVSMLNRGDKVINQIKHDPPALIILDIILPGEDGMTICQEIRTFSQVPILMLTAKVDEIDRVLGLELGADDYICKPFSPREVVSRIRNILRRTSTDHEPAGEEIVAGPITIDTEGHNVEIDGKDLRLTPIEFKLLKLMASRPGNIYKRSDFVSKFQVDDFDGDERIIDSHIKNLRKKMDEAMPGNTLIKTIYGLGYALSLSD